MDTYQFAVELFAEDGRTLGQVAVEPDWQPALEYAAFAAVRRGHLRGMPSAASACAEPLWDETRGQPFVTGFRVGIAGADSEPPVELPITYLWPQARAASAAFVESGALPAGASFWYRVCAFAAAPTSSADNAFAIEEVTTPLPTDERRLAPYLERALRWGPSADSDELPVFVPRSVLEEVLARARQHPNVEVGGVLLGKLHRDPRVPEIFLEVTAQIPARHTVADATKLTFTADTWSTAAAAIALRRRGELMAGWQHDHLNWCRHCPLENQRRCTRSNAFFSADDRHLHRVCFVRPYQVALLITDNVHTGMTWSLYGWRRGTIAERGFHIIESDEE